MMKIFMVFHEWREEDAYEYPESHSECIRAFSTLEKAKEFVESQPYREDNSYTYCSFEVE